MAKPTFTSAFATWVQDEDLSRHRLHLRRPAVRQHQTAFGEGGSGGATFIEAAALAALGAAVVIDGRGTADREREFREASYGALHRLEP